MICRPEQSKHALRPRWSRSSAFSLGSCDLGQAIRTFGNGRLNATMASRHESQASTSSTPPPSSSSSSRQSSIFRRKLGMGGHQSRQSHDQSFDSVRTSMADGTTTSTTPLSPDSLSRSSTAQPASGGGGGGGSSIPVLKPTIPAIDEDSTFVTSSKQKICLTESEETLLAALFCRVQDSHSADSVLRDPYAEPTLNRCEVDFSRSTFSVGQSSGNYVWAAHRARTLDDWCVDFVNSCDGPVTIVHLGCGLDGRYLRVRDRFSKRLQDVHVSSSFIFCPYFLQSVSFPLSLFDISHVKITMVCSWSWGC